MNYARHEPATYLVGWPQDRVLKAGFTTRQRWRKMQIHGADLYRVAFSDPPSATSAVFLEALLENEMARWTTPAFAGKAEATRHLGTSGAGWMECYRADDTAAFEHARASCLSIMLAHCLSTCHGRTDGRTDAELLTVRVNLTDRIARRGAWDSAQFRSTLMPHAASRGGQLANNLGPKPKETP